MEDTATFGGFLKEKRQSKNISLRKFAELAGISPVYMCNMEKDRNPAPSEEVLNRMVKLLLLKRTTQPPAAMAAANPLTAAAVALAAAAIA